MADQRDKDPSPHGGPRLLTPDEIDDLREEMQRDGEAMQAELKRRDKGRERP